MLFHCLVDLSIGTLYQQLFGNSFVGLDDFFNGVSIHIIVDHLNGGSIFQTFSESVVVPCLINFCSHID